MGEIAEERINGIRCEFCGVFMEDVMEKVKKDDWSMLDNPPGYPRYCEDCKDDER